MKKGGPGWYVGDRYPGWLYAVDKPVIINGREYLYVIDELVASVVRQSSIGPIAASARVRSQRG